MIQFIKTNRAALSRGCACLLLCVILFIAFFVRIQGVPLIPDDSLPGATHISTTGMRKLYQSTDTYQRGTCTAGCHSGGI